MIALLVLQLLAQAADPLLEAPVGPERQLGSWEEAVQLFSSRSADLKVAAAEVVRASGRRRQALGALLPQASGNASTSVSLLPVTGLDPISAAFFAGAGLNTLSLVASLNVIDVRAWNGLALAYAAEDAAKLTADDARRLLLLNLAQALLAVVAAERVAELSRVGLKDAIDRATLAERSAKAGASTEIDLGRTRQDAELQRAQVVNADEQLKQAREALGLALGVDEAVGLSREFQLEGLAARVPAQCRGLAGLQERPDILAAKAREKVAHRGVLDVKAGFLPTVGVRTNAQALFIPNSNTLTIWNLQAVLTVPIWDGGARYGALREAHALEDEAHARREAAERAGRVDVERARRQVEVATKARELAASALAEALKLDTLTRKAFDAGLGTSLELVTAASGLRQQQLNLALREYDVLRARVVALFALAGCSP